MLVGLIHLSESLKRTKTDLPLDKKGFCWLMAFIFELQHHFSLGLQPAACSLMCTFWNCSLHNPMSQFFSVNSLSLSIYIFFLLVLFLWRTLTQCSTLRLCVWRLAYLKTFHLISFYQCPPHWHFPHTLTHLYNHTVNLPFTAASIQGEDSPPGMNNNCRILRSASTSTILLVCTAALLVKLLLILFKFKVVFTFEISVSKSTH